MYEPANFSLPPFLLGNRKLLFYVCEAVSLWKRCSFVSMFRVHLEMISHNPSLFLSFYFTYPDHLCFLLCDCKWHYFIPPDGWVLLHRVYAPHFFIHSSVLSHLGCSRALVTVPSAAVTAGVQVSFKTLVSTGSRTRHSIARSRELIRLVL